MSGRLEQRCAPPMIDFSSRFQSQSQSAASALQLPGSMQKNRQKNQFSKRSEAFVSLFLLFAVTFRHLWGKKTLFIYLFSDKKR